MVGYLEKLEMDALLAAPDRRTVMGARDYALLLFLYNSGARADEVAKLSGHRRASLQLGRDISQLCLRRDLPRHQPPRVDLGGGGGAAHAVGVGHGDRFLAQPELAPLLADRLAPLCVARVDGRLQLAPGVLKETNGIALLAARGFDAAVGQGQPGV